MTPGGPCSDCIEMSFRHDLHWRGIFVVGMRPQPLPRTSKAPHFLGIFWRDFCLTIGGDFIPSKVSIIAALRGSSNPSTGGRFCPSKRLSIQENNFILPPQINMRNRPDQGAQESIPLPQRPASAAPHAKSLRSLPAKEIQGPSLQIAPEAHDIAAQLTGNLV